MFFANNYLTEYQIIIMEFLHNFFFQDFDVNFSSHTAYFNASTKYFTPIPACLQIFENYILLPFTAFYYFSNMKFFYLLLLFYTLWNLKSGPWGHHISLYSRFNLHNKTMRNKVENMGCNTLH